tara:strand:+ start:235 stop:366 length:132 start_codon:yes stop_codon:yes gene_type:complete
MSNELKEIIELATKYGYDVSHITEEQAINIINMANELKANIEK